MHSAQLYAVKYMRFRPDERLKYIEILIKSPQQVFEKEQQVKEVLFFEVKNRSGNYGKWHGRYFGGRCSTCPWKESHRI